jgi:hypothetical protein
MRFTRLVGAALGTGLLFLAAAGGAQAYDHRERERDHWRHEEWRHDHRYENRYVHERPVVVRERPVYVERERPVMVRERPVFVQPAPMYAAPMQMPMYQNQGPSGLNLNFNIPLN